MAHQSQSQGISSSISQVTGILCGSFIQQFISILLFSLAPPTYLIKVIFHRVLELLLPCYSITAFLDRDKSLSENFVGARHIRAAGIILEMNHMEPEWNQNGTKMEPE